MQITLGTVLLGALTLAMLHLVPRYQTIGPELAPWINEDSFADAWLGAREAAIQPPDALVLTNDNLKRSSALRLHIPVPATHIVQVSGDFALRDVVAGGRPWQRARCFLLGRVGDGKWKWYFPGTIFTGEGTQAFTASLSARIPPDISELELNLGLYRATGTLTTQHFSIKAAEVSRPYLFWRGAVLAAWGLWCALMIVLVLRSRAPFLTLPVVLLVSTLLLMPEDAKTSLTHQLFQGVNHLVQQLHSAPPAAIKPGVAATPQAEPIDSERDVERMLPPDFGLDRTTHVTVFSLATLLLLWVNRRGGLIAPATYVALYAGSSEILQHFSPGRTPDIVDFGIDMLGIVAGMLMVVMGMWVERFLRSGGFAASGRNDNG